MKGKITMEKRMIKIQKRLGVFETNSSSSHSVCIYEKSEWDKFVAGELIYDDYNGDFIPLELMDKDADEYRYIDYDRFFDDKEIETAEYTTKHGDEIIAVSEYSYG